MTTPTAGKILLVADRLPDDSLSGFLRKTGWLLKHANPSEFATVMSLEAPDAILLQPDDNVILLRQRVDVVRNFDDNLPIIVLSAKGDVMQAVELVRQGAYDYFTEPLDLERLNTSLAHAVRMYRLTKKVFLLENQMGWRGGFDELIGHS